MDELRPDLCVLGSGSGAQALAGAAAAFGLFVVLVEGRAFSPGSHQISPLFTLLAAGRIVKTLQDGADFGVEAGAPAIDFRRIGARAERIAALAAPNFSRARLEAMNVRVIASPGRFAGRAVLEAGGARIKARRFVIATGAAPVIPAIAGLNLVRPLSIAALCALNDPPQRLIVLGDDPRGLALAQALRRLGGEAIVFPGGPVLPLVDDELAEPARIRALADGVIIHENASVARIEPHGAGLRVFVAGANAPIEGSHLLVAAGEAPLVEGFGLGAAGVRYDERGVDVGRDLRTSNRRVFAIGPAARVAQGEGAEDYHAGVVLRAALGLPAANIAAYSAAKVIWTDPAIAVAGLTEAEARASGLRFRILRAPFAETDRGRIDGVAGCVKLVVSPNGRILGAGLVGFGAEELINLLTLAISKGVNAAEIGAALVAYPSLAAAIRRAGEGFAARRRLDPMVRWILRALRRIG